MSVRQRLAGWNEEDEDFDDDVPEGEADDEDEDQDEDEDDDFGPEEPDERRRAALPPLAPGTARRQPAPARPAA